MKSADEWFKEWPFLTWNELVEKIREEQRQECAGKPTFKPLHDAISGFQKMYRYQDNYIRWGLVEADMKKRILNAGVENASKTD